MCHKWSHFLLSVIGVILLGSLGWVGICEAAEKYLPRELNTLAQQAKCDPVPGFFDRAGMINPPYIYGYAPGLEDDSAAFWCYKKDKKMNILMFTYKGKLATPGKCLPYVELKDRFPGGLSLSKERHIPLSNFLYWENPRKHGPTGRVTDYPAIIEEYDGVGHLLYCHEGKWLFLLQH